MTPSSIPPGLTTPDTLDSSFGKLTFTDGAPSDARPARAMRCRRPSLSTAKR